MTSAVIDRLRVRWRPSSPSFPERDRCDALLDELVRGGRLGDAIDGRVSGDGEVCVRAVVVPPITIVFDEPDDALVDAWADVVAAAIAEAERAGDVVRYRSRADALVDVVLSAVAGDLSRSWAWRQLGLWLVGAVDVGGEASSGTAIGVENALLALPTSAVAVLAEVARRGALAAVVRLLGATAFARVIGAALVAGGGNGDRWLAAVRRHALAARPNFPGAAMTMRPLVSGGDDESHDEEPFGATRSLEAVSTSEQALVDAVRAAMAAVPEAGAALVAFLAMALQPAAVAAPRAWAQVVTRAERALQVIAADLDAHVDADADDAVIDDTATALPSAAEDMAPARTAWGGLLFAIHVMHDVLDDATASTAALHAIGLALLERAAAAEHAPRPPEPDDPALLAFCGLRPGDEPPLTDQDLDIVAVAVAERIAVALAERLDAHVATPELLAGLFARDAEIVADPGWFEVRFPIESVSVDVRRAGLDLDPGPVPWLGAVVVFRYVGHEELA